MAGSVARFEVVVTTKKTVHTSADISAVWEKLLELVENCDEIELAKIEIFKTAGDCPECEGKVDPCPHLGVSTFSKETKLEIDIAALKSIIFFMK
ncbi:MAG: hypothetical protein KBD55_02100 [Candidatus Pacebacteria bacterium]|nr:hypothetical protein [Candidatus Paceibacterota bacterium]